jgi:RNA polymerase sigma-70 factor (ECF subfamily)
MNEREAIARLKQGDIRGLEALVRDYQVRAVRAATLITHDRPLAEDIVQAAFIRVYERIHQFDAERPFGPWFLRSVVNDAVKTVSRHRPHISLSDPLPWEDGTLADSLPNPEEQLEQAETREAIWEALAQLPPEQRAAVVLRYFLGLTETEIADDQARPKGTIKWRLHAARERLRALLTPWRSDLTPETPTSAQREN